MQEFINRITKQVGIGPQQAQQIINVIGGFLKETDPTIGFAVEKGIPCAKSRSNLRGK